VRTAPGRRGAGSSPSARGPAHGDRGEGSCASTCVLGEEVRTSRGVGLAPSLMKIAPKEVSAAWTSSLVASISCSDSAAGKNIGERESRFGGQDNGSGGRKYDAGNDE